MAKSKKVVKFHKTLRLNMAVVVFLVVFFYMLYNMFRYFTTPQVAVYEVTQGSIVQDNLYTGAILRQEKVFYTEEAGYINYYNKDASRVGVETYVYSVDGNGDFYNKVIQQNDGQLFKAEGSYSKLEEVAEGYVLGYSNEKFHQVYAFKHEVEAGMMEAASTNALSILDGQEGGALGVHAHTAEEPGIVVYNTDGLESVDLENFTEDLFRMEAHPKNNLISRGQVAAGDAAYKLITSEAWTLVVPVDQKVAGRLQEETSLKVRFKKDNSTAWGASSIVSRGGAYYLALSFQDSALRFATDRYLEIELSMSEARGLKIPNTALTEKKFLVIPKDYYTYDKDTDSNGVISRYTGEDGNVVEEFIAVSVAGEKKGKYYIASSKLKKGDTIIHPETAEKYTMDRQKTLKGVYNINRGYAVFRKVEALAKNQEYTIINTGTDYGISLYDHIALDASAVKELQTIQ